MTPDFVFDGCLQRDDGFEILADIPGVEKNDIKCAAKCLHLLVRHGAACTCRQRVCAAPWRCVLVIHAELDDMRVANAMLMLCGVAGRLSVEGDVLSIKVEKEEAPTADATSNPADDGFDDCDAAMTSAEGEHGQNGASRDGAVSGGADGAGGVKCAFHPFTSLRSLW